MAEKRPRAPRTPTVTVNVTQDILDRSIEKSSRLCMIAEAMKVALPHATQVAVDLQACRFTDPKTNRRYVYLTPPVAQIALLHFDVGMKPEPLQFRLSGGQVTTATVGKNKKRTPEDLEKRRAKDQTPERKAMQKAHEQMRAFRKRTLVKNNGNGSYRVVGGKEPPQLKLQREFGVRAYQRFNDELKAKQAVT